MEQIQLEMDDEALLRNITSEQLENQKLVTPIKTTRDGIIVKRNTSHWVGSLVVGDKAIIIPPQFEPSLFVDLYLYANGANVLTWDQSQLAPTGSYFDSGKDGFLVLLASVLVEQVQRVIGHNLAKRYVEKTERLQGIKGRPIWAKDFGHHPSEGKTCRFFELSHQNKLNEAILVALELASSILQGTPQLSRCQELIFQWRGILSSCNHSPSIAREAIQDLTRLTEHYRTPLLIGQALMERKRTDIFGASLSPLPTLEFYLPTLFEKFVYRLISEALSGAGLRAKEQVFDSKALVDGLGEKYRSIIPDILLYQLNNVTGIIDAKFKPRYVTGLPGNKIPKNSRVTNADIYQLFFYQARIAKLSPDSEPPATAIVAPLFGDSECSSDAVRREIIWTEQDKRDSEFKIKVLSIPMAAIFSSIAKGDPAAVSVKYAPELQQFLHGLAPEVKCSRLHEA